MTDILGDLARNAPFAAMMVLPAGHSNSKAGDVPSTMRYVGSMISEDMSAVATSISISSLITQNPLW